MNDWENPLTWGQTVAQMKKALSKLNDYSMHPGSVRIGKGILSNFPGDCGSLILQGANHVSKKDVKHLTQLASNSGFSKIFATVVKEYTSDAERDLDIKTRFRCWKKVSVGKSNRTPTKDDIVLVHIIKNCKYKGY